MEHNVATNEIRQIPTTEAELAREQTPEQKAKQDAFIAELAIKESKKLEVLAKLGLTAEEAQALFG